MNMIEELRLKHEVENEKLRIREREAKIRAACVTGPEGQLIRGYVTQVRCGGCGSLRWNDGTPCGVMVANKYDAKVTRACGHRLTRDIDAMEDGRIG